MKYLWIIGAALVVTPTILFAGLFYIVSGWEREVQKRDYVPSGMRIFVVDFASDPNVVAYNPEKVSRQALEKFANAHCGIGVLELADQEPSFLNKLRGENRAIIRCQ